MFEDSLIASGGVLKTKRPAATAASLLLQAALLALLAGLPLLYTQALPPKWHGDVLALGPPAPAPPPAAEQRRPVRPVESDMIGQRLLQPRAIPRSIAMIHESQAPLPAAPLDVFGAPGGTGPSGNNGVLRSLLGIVPSVAAPPPSASRPLRVSQGVEQGLLVREVKPVYPPLARQARIQGSVVLQAIIGKDGGIENLRVVSGHPMLAPAAIKAVRQWRYRPYTLNGEPVPIETEITVNFVLGGG